jgi:hypothetical protein
MPFFECAAQHPEEASFFGEVTVGFRLVTAGFNTTQLPAAIAGIAPTADCIPSAYKGVTLSPKSRRQPLRKALD